jgi:hypothetical protein
MVSDLQARLPASTTTTAPKHSTSRVVYCLPARAQRDDLAAAMLAHLLREKGYSAVMAPFGVREIAQTITLVREAKTEVLCITVVPPSTVIQARFLCAKLIAEFPELKIVVTLWGGLPNLTEASERLYKSGATQVAINLEGAVKLVDGLNAAVNPPAPG